jgi:hypothetical protein
MYAIFQKQMFKPIKTIQIEMYSTDFSDDHWKMVIAYGMPMLKLK